MRSSWTAEAVLVLLLAVVTTSVLTHPLVARMDRVGRINTGDGQLSIWNVAWVARTLPTDPLHVFDANIFYPHRDTLAYSEANIGAGVLAMPVWWATKNPYFAHNSVVFVAFVLSVAGAYALARRLTGHVGAAVFAGIAFAFCPFIYARTAHIQLLMTAGLPWSLWAWHRFADRPAPRRAVALGVLLALQALSCAYYGIFAGLSVGLATLWYSISRGLWRSPRYWTWVALAAITSVVLVAPFFRPYLRIEGADFNRSLSEADDYAANWQAYLASSTYAHRWMLDLMERWKEVAFPGILASTLGLAAIGLAIAGRLPKLGTSASGNGTITASPRETVGFYGLLGAIAAWCSFGPNAGLYSVMFYAIPLFGYLRAPGRLAIVVTLALVICSAVLIAHLARGGGRWRRALPAALAILVLGELSAMPLPIPDVDPTPDPVHHTLARLPKAVVAEFPFFWSRSDFPRHAYYMLESTAHWQPLVNGYSDHFPTDYRAMLEDVAGFPTRAAFRHLRARRTRYVVFHLRFYDQRSRQRLFERIEAYAEFLAPIQKDQDVWLYEITSWPD